MKKYGLTSDYIGFHNKKDITNDDPRALVSPSQNVIINDAEKIEIRAGYELDGTADTSGVGCNGSFDWITNSNTERNLRVTGAGEVQVRYVDSLGVVTYKNIMPAFTAGTEVNFATWWSTGENKDLLLFVAQNANIYMWSGAITTLASLTANTITKEGATWFSEERFLVAGTRQVTIGTQTYSYTGGEGSGTLTGVTPDPTVGGHIAGDIIMQTVRTTSNKPAAGLTNSVISNLNNYIYIGGYNSRAVYVSKSADYTDFTFTAVRLPGEGAILYLDSNVNGFANSDEGNQYISGKNDDWYQAIFTLSSDNTKEALNIKRLKSGTGQGAISQGAIGNIKNAILFINNDFSVDQIGRVENLNTPQSKPLSDNVSSEFESYNYTISPHVKFFHNQTFVAIPSESKVMIYDHEKGFWMPPQILPVARFAIINGELYGHSKDNKETYKLFTGTSDNGQPINAIAAFAYNNFGRPDWKKSFDSYFVEGYISPNTTLTLGVKYEFGGFLGNITKNIVGNNNKIIIQTASDGSLGKSPFGKNPLGSVTDSIDNIPKFRDIKSIPKEDFYECQIYFQTNEVDYQWQLLRHGPNILSSRADGIEIKE